MIVLDTNVPSETIKPSPSPRVLRWLAAQKRSMVFTTAITKAEMLYGAEVLPAGKRRIALQKAINDMFAYEFAGRVLAFDENAARVFATIGAVRQRIGRPISEFDAAIAAITRSRHAVLATRNVNDFIGCEIEVVNPWSE